MNQKNSAVLALDVGEKRIGVAAADGVVPIARPLGFIEVDGTEVDKINQYALDEKAGVIVIGYPRNQSGEATAQTKFVEDFKQKLEEKVDLPMVFQDESVTSVIAEERLKQSGRPYEKGDIDAQAAALILQDYLEYSSGRI